MLPDFIKEKSREISYAPIRVSFYVKRAELRSRLETLAVELLENSARASVDAGLENVNRALASISVLDSLVRLAHSVYEIEPVNATILVRELDSLNSAMRQYGNPSAGSGEEKLPDLENLFPTQCKTEQQEDEFIENKNELKQSGNPSTELRVNGNSAINAAIRQSAVINKIKEGNPSTSSGQDGCRLKDLTAEFPDVSERTLRYDLQKLCEQNVIKRVGNGGPASYYCMAEQGEPKEAPARVDLYRL